MCSFGTGTELRRSVTGDADIEFTLSVGFGMEVVISNPVRPIRTVQIEIPDDRISDRATELWFMSKSSLDFEDIRATSRPDTEYKLAS